jgi:ring-1,2-phenylacetyl-CoA epoxidase subunit PaaB
MKTYEVFLKKAGKDEFRHAGALDAPDDDMARLLARESYVRRGEGAQMWLVARSAIIEADEEFLSPNFDKPHRHNDGSNIAARRKRKRSETDSSETDGSEKEGSKA